MTPALMLILTIILIVVIAVVLFWGADQVGFPYPVNMLVKALIFILMAIAIVTKLGVL